MYEKNLSKLPELCKLRCIGDIQFIGIYYTVLKISRTRQTFLSKMFLIAIFTIKIIQYIVSRTTCIKDQLGIEM